jgi:hypothetical protein
MGFLFSKQKKRPPLSESVLNKQVNKINYGRRLPVSCLTETCPDPTTEVVDMGLRLDLVSKQKAEYVNIEIILLDA